MSTEQIGLIIGGLQLLFALFVFLGVDSRIFSRPKGLSAATLPTMPQMTKRSKTVLILIMGGLLFSGYGFCRTFDHPEVTPQNVEANIRQWLESFSISVTKSPSPPDMYFLLQARLQSDIPVLIFRPKIMNTI